MLPISIWLVLHSTYVRNLKWFRVNRNRFWTRQTHNIVKINVFLIFSVSTVSYGSSIFGPRSRVWAINRGGIVFTLRTSNSVGKGISNRQWTSIAFQLNRTRQISGLWFMLIVQYLLCEIKVLIYVSTNIEREGKLCLAQYLTNLTVN